MEAIAEKVIEGLGSLAIKELAILCNFKDDLDNMKSMVSAIKAVLRDAEAKEMNHQVSDWLEKLKDVLLDADDLLDDFSAEALAREVMTQNKMAKKSRLGISHHWRGLHFDECSSLTSLPESIGNLTSLNKFRLSKCSSLASLPESIGNLTSLNEFSLVECHMLVSLPEGIRNLKSLQELEIYDCPLLKERCRNEGGEDWPKIAHIPTIRVL